MKGKSVIPFFLLYLFYLAILTSCQDRNNVFVTGRVIDSMTGEPISNAEIVVLCWYIDNIDEASYEKQNLIADKNGIYKANFRKGHQVDIASKAKGYLPYRSYNKLTDNEVDVTLKLAKQPNNPTLEVMLTTDQIIFDSEDDPTFLRVRVYADKEGKDLDFTNVETFGFDFKTKTTNIDTLETDIWFRVIKKEGQPTTIAAAKNGGVIPILDKQVKSSLLFEKDIAPTTGYKSTYQLTGEEAGFFVLCRDGKTYGKMIFEHSLTDTSIPDGKGSYYREFGRNFSSLYQPNGTTDLAYATTEIDLKDFLVDSRYR